jgi:hypothetical protein
MNIGVLKGFSESRRGKYAVRGNTLFESLKGSLGEIKTNDMNTLKQDYILSSEANSSEARAILFNKNFYTRTRSLMANLKTVECYATRKMTNSYYCPLAGQENSYFIWGGLAQSKDASKDACEDLCSIPVTCMSKNMNKDINVILKGSPEVIDGTNSIVLNVDDEMLGEFIELAISNTYQYDENISIGTSDYNLTKAVEILQKSKHRVKMDLSYLDEDGSYKKLLSSYNCSLNDISISYKIYLPRIRTSSLKIDFHTPFELVKDSKKELDVNLESTLESISIKYIGNEWWFCPETHFVTSASQCGGEIKTVSIGSEAMSVCVTESRRSREPVYGAFYSESACQNACQSQKECVPTYKHMSNLDPYNLPESLRDIEIGCVDTPSNTSCTKELCVQKYADDVMPYLEKSWTNDDKIAITVSSGIPSKKYARPRIDVQGGLSANGDADLRKKASIREMSEISYFNMINSETYEIASHNVGVNIPARNGYELMQSGMGSGSLVWNLKPASFDINNAQSYYFYSLFEVSSNFVPNAPSLANLEGAIEPRLDKTIILKTSSGFKVIHRTQNAAIEKYETDGTRKWYDTPSVSISNYETFLGVGFAGFDENSNAESFKSSLFTGATNYESIPLYLSIEQLTSVMGVLFTSQSSQGNGRFFTRIYDGAEDLRYASSFNGLTAYALYSKDRLTYKELVEKTIGDISGKNAIFSTKHRVSSGSLLSDGVYNSKKVQMFIGGRPDKMSVNVDFEPSAKEEGKRTFVFMLLFDENSTVGGN